MTCWRSILVGNVGVRCASRCGFGCVEQTRSLRFCEQTDQQLQMRVVLDE